MKEVLAESSFFSDLRDGRAGVEAVREVFGQYYLWRNQFHRWFGVCVVKSPSFGTRFDTSFVLSELTEHIDEEISGDHHGMAVTFLAALGVERPGDIEALPVTVAYSESFLLRYLDPDRSGEEALSALAGREIVAPARNRITIDALAGHYGVKAGLEFFGLHEELEVEHFASLWNAVVSGYSADEGELVEAARREIREHVAFWDDVYAEVSRERVDA
ncbi:iron-containing redox enzyme family protein [Actinomadura barringtoniae]|uniref:Iron-containing redox enzyme family protein n=1 Tax=Actinomadura barringtoniae TaxID=1427535 RepID=A0A939T2W2_9ACTN|nr:iron-containing redox enzyme family protein [Actinomadura barringtoniae]MBO2447218.1 iron-containing redox enzyme family protein [Actinomadura barringtoniae]